MSENTQTEKKAEEERKVQRNFLGMKKKKKKSPKEEAREWIVTLALALVVAIGVRGFVCEPVSVDGSSMWATLFHEEIMLVSKWDYSFGGEPELFDVVICHYPDRGKINFVKRIVGMPGDTVELKDGYLYVNDVRYEEPYLVHRDDHFGPFTVPEGHYFLMGDNRTNSNDSRNPAVGPVSRDMIMGKVRYVMFPLDHAREIVNGLDFTGEPVILAPEEHD